MLHVSRTLLNVDFNNSTKYWICDNVYIDDDVKKGDHDHINEKCRDSADRNFNMKAKLNSKSLSYFTT